MSEISEYRFSSLSTPPLPFPEDGMGYVILAPLHVLERQGDVYSGLEDGCPVTKTNL